MLFSLIFGGQHGSVGRVPVYRNRKVAKPWIRLPMRGPLCSWERHLMLFPTLVLSSLSRCVAQPDERHARRTASVLEWYDRHRA